MLNESWPWKSELLACAQRLREAAEASSSPDWPPSEESDEHDPVVEAIYSIERDVMIGCFALRRLLGMSYKVTQEVRKKTVPVTIYPIREGQQPPDAFDALDAFDFYNLDQPSSQTITTQQMCNLFIHSHVLHFAWELIGMSPQESLTIDEDDPRVYGPVQLGGFYVATDTSSKTHLTRVGLESLTSAFDEMGRDNVISISWRRDHRGRRRIQSVEGGPFEE